VIEYKLKKSGYKTDSEGKALPERIRAACWIGSTVCYAKVFGEEHGIEGLTVIRVRSGNKVLTQEGFGATFRHASQGDYVVRRESGKILIIPGIPFERAYEPSLPKIWVDNMRDDYIPASDPNKYDYAACDDEEAAEFLGEYDEDEDDEDDEDDDDDDWDDDDDGWDDDDVDW